MYYCTLFNSYYLSRGLALYQSLLDCAPTAQLIIFAFDEQVYSILAKMNLKQVTLIALQEFETAELLRVKGQRTVAEYCWTCTAATILYCLEKLNLPEVCYLDADLYFWQDPKLLLEEALEASILITEHRYTKQYDNAALSGKYCVQFMYFKNDNYGLTALKWWKEACIAWCYNRVEEGKFGDQKYLDDWIIRFQGVKVLSHLGGGVAPWNVQQYDVVEATQQRVLLKERKTDIKFNLVFYHFHALKFINDKIDLGAYKLSKHIKQTIYQPYVNQLLAQEEALKKDPDLASLIQSLNIHGHARVPKSLLDWLRDLKKKFKGVYNTKRKQAWHTSSN